MNGNIQVILEFTTLKKMGTLMFIPPNITSNPAENETPEEKKDPLNPDHRAQTKRSENRFAMAPKKLESPQSPMDKWTGPQHERLLLLAGMSLAWGLTFFILSSLGVSDDTSGFFAFLAVAAVWIVWFIRDAVRRFKK